jgi:hypothetical protein
MQLYGTVAERKRAGNQAVVGDVIAASGALQQDADIGEDRGAVDERARSGEENTEFKLVLPAGPEWRRGW